MECDAATHDAVTKIVTQTPKYIFWANSEQHVSWHALSRGDRTVLGVSDVGVEIVLLLLLPPPIVVIVTPVTLSAPSGTLDVTESECVICGWVCNAVNPPNGPFGESPVTLIIFGFYSFLF